jgi:membrane-associated phospholipid phosphatase
MCFCNKTPKALCWLPVVKAAVLTCYFVSSIMLSRFLLLLLFAISLPCKAQHRLLFFDNAASPYAVSWKADAFLAPAGLGLLGAALIADIHKPNATFGSYRKQDIWRPDRGFVCPINHRAAAASDVFMFTSLGAPALLLIDKKIRRDKSFYIMWAEVMVLNAGFTQITKALVDRPRPYAYTTNSDPQTVTGKEPLRSFFSGHTSYTAASLFFIAKVYHDYHPHSPWRYVLWGNAAVTPAVTGFLRVRAGKHFPTDVAVGYAVGAATGILVPYVHQKIRQRQNRNINEPTEGL